MGLRCSVGISLVAESGGYSLVVVQGHLITMASLVAEQGYWSSGSVVMALGLSCSTTCGIFLDQRSNLSLLCWQADSLPLSHQGSLHFFFY